MKGSTGEVALKLAYPIVVESVSVDHVSSKIVKDGKTDSAPKRMKVIGYPPCADSSICPAVGFNISDPVDIAEIHYDVDGPSVQNFDSHYKKAIANMSPTASQTVAFDIDGIDENVYEDEDEIETSSCSLHTSCSAPPRIIVAAVVFKIMENWGNLDFTCLYRFRLHGDLT